MRPPRLFQRTPFRLTLVFLALFAAVTGAVLAYIYSATVANARQDADIRVRAERAALLHIYNAQVGMAQRDALNAALIERALKDSPYLYVLADASGQTITGNIDKSPIPPSPQIASPQAGPQTAAPAEVWTDFRIAARDETGRQRSALARGVQVRLSGGESLFVGLDQGDVDTYLKSVVHALWGAGALVVALGLAGGLLVSRSVERSTARLNQVLAAVQAGDVSARALVRGTGDEFDELSSNLNATLDRLESSMAGLRHAGDAIAHDLRSPLTRLRTGLEAALLDLEMGRGDADAALNTALLETDRLLSTFSAVLAIARLEAAGQIHDPQTFDANEVAADLHELYGPVAEDRGVTFDAQIDTGLSVRGDRAFLAQALANLVDNGLKYTPPGGAVRLRARRRASGDVELSVTDTGPGVPPPDRERVKARFVRLEQSRSAHGAGLGLSLVEAVAKAHGGRLELTDGPGRVRDSGPGLRAALILPAAS